MSKLDKIIVLEDQEKYREKEHQKKIAKNKVALVREIEKEKHIEKNQ